LNPPSTKRTRRREFLDEMGQVVPLSDLAALIAPYTPESKRGRPPFPVESLLRTHFHADRTGDGEIAAQHAAVP
jgi:hypothetical protein